MSITHTHTLGRQAVHHARGGASVANVQGLLELLAHLLDIKLVGFALHNSSTVDPAVISGIWFP